MQVMTRRLVMAGGAAVAGMTVASALLLRKRQAEPEAQTVSAPLSPPPMQGMAALHVVTTPAPPPAIRFLRADGTAEGLDAYAGQGLVVNLWATWCAPCVRELPSLAKLAATLAPDRIAVLPLSSDRGGAPAVQAYFAAHGITGLPVLLDPDGAAAAAWKSRGIPTTIVIDRQGRVRAWLEGAADWSTPEAAATIRKLAG